MRAPLIALFCMAAVPTPVPALAQAWLGGPPHSLADQQRWRTEELRLRASEQSAFARQYRTDAGLTRLQLLAAQRRADPPVLRTEPPLDMPTRSLDAERQGREQATARREVLVAGVRQIDDWLDGEPR